MISSSDVAVKSSKLPLVCICVPTYNVAGTVRESLESILRQTYANMVVRISDNASTDDTLKIVEAIADPRITIHSQDRNYGAERNFTSCIELAEGKYTAIFHADDIYEPDMVAKQVAFLEANEEVGAVFTEATMINEFGVALGVTGAVPGNKGGVRRIDFREILQTILLHHNFLVCPSAMVRTEIYKTDIIEWGSPAFRSASDVDVWLRLARRKTIAVLDERLMRYRISNTQGSYKNRTRTERLDFFLVMDHYLERSDVCDVITAEDLRHYGWLDRHERVARAMILFNLGRVAEARELLKGVFCWDAIRAALSTRRGFVTLAGSMLLLAMLPLGDSRVGRAVVSRAKKISWR